MVQLFETNQVRGGDVVCSEDAGEMITRESAIIDNSAGETDLEVPAGQPIIYATGVLVIAANIATATGIVIESALVPAGEKVKVAVLARGPAAVNGDRLPTTDMVAAAINMTNFKARLVALGLVIRLESPTQEQS